MGIPTTYLIISVIENTLQDWSFGLVKTHFLAGDLSLGMKLS